MVAPQNLHFTGSLFWSEETVWPLPHKGHMRLRLKIRRSADIKNGFKVLSPIQGFVLRTRMCNIRNNFHIPNYQAAKDTLNSFGILRIQG